MPAYLPTVSKSTFGDWLTMVRVIAPFVPAWSSGKGSIRSRSSSCSCFIRSSGARLRARLLAERNVRVGGLECGLFGGHLVEHFGRVLGQCQAIGCQRGVPLFEGRGGAALGQIAISLNGERGQGRGGAKQQTRSGDADRILHKDTRR